MPLVNPIINDILIIYYVCDITYIYNIPEKERKCYMKKNIII